MAEVENLTVLQAGVAAQNSTSNQNAGVSLQYPQVPHERFIWSDKVNLTLNCGLVHTSTYQNNVVLISAKQDATGNYRLCVQQRSEDAITPSAATAVSVGVASGALVAANTSRRYLVLVNTSVAARVSLGFGAAAVLDSGITLMPNGGSYEMSEAAGNLYRGAINAIASAAATNVAVQEAT